MSREASVNIENQLSQKDSTETNPIKTKRRCLILGCGAVAIRMGLELQQQQWEIHAIRRSPTHLPESFIVTAIDIHLLDSDFFTEQSPFDAIIYSVTPDKRTDDAYHNAYVRGVEHILKILKTNPPRFWLHFSSSRVWAEDNGSIVDEQTAIQASSDAAASLIASESLIQQSGLPHSILRFSGIYGKTETSLQTRLQAWAASNFDSAAASQRWSNRIHVADAAGFAAYLLSLYFSNPTDNDIHQLYAVTDNRPTQAYELQTWAQKTLSLQNLSNQQNDINPATNQNHTSVTSGLHKKIDNSRLQQSGYQLMYPTFESGYAEISVINHRDL